MGVQVKTRQLDVWELGNQFVPDALMVASTYCWVHTSFS